MPSLLLEPVLIAVYPRWSEAADLVRKVMGNHTGDSFSIAFAEGDQTAEEFRKGWPQEEHLPLLLLRCPEQESVGRVVEAIRDIGARKPGRALGILLADGPEVSGFEELRRSDWNNAFAKAVSEAVVDVQVFEYSSTWGTAPPRVR